MLTRHTRIARITIGTLLMSIILFAASVGAQNQPSQSNAIEKPTPEPQISPAPAEISTSARAPKTNVLIPIKPVASPSPEEKNLQNEIDEVKAENAIVREQVRLLMEQNRKTLEQLSRLQRKLDSEPISAVLPDGATTGLSPAAARPGDPDDENK